MTRRGGLCAALSMTLGTVLGGLFVLDWRGCFAPQTRAIATLEHAEGLVRHLPRHTWSWNWIGRGAGVAQFDTVATGEQGRAVLKYYDGTLLEIGRGAMVVIGDPFKGIDLKLLHGSDRVRVLKKGTAVSKTHPTLTWTPVSETTIRNPSKVLVADSPQHILPNLDLPPEPILKTPEDGWLFDLTQKTPDAVPLRLEWKPSSARQRYEVRVGDKVFTVSQPQLSIQNLPKGKYAWSVRAFASNGVRSPASESRVFEIRRGASLHQPVVLPVKIGTIRKR